MGTKIYKNRFPRISSSKVDQLASNQDQNESATNSTHMVEYISPAEMLCFCDICL